MKLFATTRLQQDENALCDDVRADAGKLEITGSIRNFLFADDSGPGHYLVRTFTITALIVAAPLHAHNH